MARLLILTPAELTRDPRARRAATAALGRGLEVRGLCIAGATPVPLDEVPVTRVPPDPLTARRPTTSGDPPTQPLAIREARGIFRLVRLGRTTVRLARAGRGIEPAIVHANDFDTLPAAAWLARRGRARLVYDAHELYTGFESRPPLCWSTIQRQLEGILARRADAVITVSPGIADRLQKLHSLTTTPLVTFNCPPVSSVAAPSRGAGEPLQVVYQAAVGPNRNISDLFDAASRTDGVRITIRVAGADPARLRHEAFARGVAEQVEISDPVAPDELLSALAPHDVGVVIDRRATDNTELALPNKLFEYLMAGLAVVVPRLEAMADLVEREAVGLAYEPGSPRDLGRALTELAADRPRLEAMKHRARQLALERYNAEAQEPVLLEAWGL
jgi:glycogen(starch) synthase